ncbi:FtsX-like permease family protein [Paenibacillus daejeonensis]|uniref:FtsX-like permease family protein n=1 Tax=Paenibacillus daejeonensis TaxID=135193 RepID=UPI000370C250|nr:FtsX-like permease family protein [Paenibacillus daejeonensis]
MKLMKWMVGMIMSQKLRNVFILIGISLGAIIIASSQILMASIEQSNEASVKELFGDMDMYVGHQLSMEHDTDEPLSEEEVQQISSLEHVAAITPMLYPYLGKEAEYNMWDTVYVGFKDEPLAYESTMVEIGDQKLPDNGEVIISSQYAHLHNIEIGDSMELPFPPGPDRMVRVAGFHENFEYLNRIMIFNYDWLESETRSGPTMLMVKLDTHQAKANVASDIHQQVNASLKIDLLKEADEQRENIGGFYPILSGLNMAVLIVSSLLLISVMQISVQEKQQELAVYRIVGASKRFIFRMNLLESLIIGGIAVLVGSGIGIVLPIVILTQIDTLIHVPITEIAIPWFNLCMQGLLYAILLCAAATIPAYQASKVPPMEAYRAATLQPISEQPKYLRGTMLLLFSFIVSAVSLIINNSILHVVSIVILVALFIYGLPLYLRLGILGFLWFMRRWTNHRFFRIAPLNALRQFKRNLQIASIVTTSFSLAALGFATLETMRHETVAAMFSQNPADLRIVQAAYGNHGLEAEGFSEALYERVMTLEGVTEDSLFFTTSRYLRTNNLPNKQVAHTTDGSLEVNVRLTGTHVGKLLELGKVVEGLTDPAHLTEDQVVITREAATYLGYKLGDIIELTAYEEDSNRIIQLEVATIIEAVDILGEDNPFLLLTSAEHMASWFNVTNHEELRVNLDDASLNLVLSDIEQFIDDLGITREIAIFDRYAAMSEFIEQYNQRIFILIIAVVIMLALSLMGMMNNAISSIKERLPEFSVLRVLGMSKHTLRLSLLVEGAMITTICGAVSLLLSLWISMHIGLFLGASSMPMPLALVVTLLLLAPLLGLAALFIPAIWASNRNILSHIK